MERCKLSLIGGANVVKRLQACLFPPARRDSGSDRYSFPFSWARDLGNAEYIWERAKTMITFGPFAHTIVHRLLWTQIDWGIANDQWQTS